MSEEKLIRQAGGITAAGAALGLGVSLMLNAAYSLTPDGAGITIPPWQPALEQIARPALVFAPAVEVYHLYGRIVFLVVAAFAIGLYGLYANQRAVFIHNIPRALRWGYRLTMIGLVLNLIGNLGDYWIALGEIPGLVLFVVGTVVGLLLQAAGLALLGVSGLRSASLPRASALAMILWFPFTFVLFLIGMNNLPAAPLLALSLTWGITSISMVRSRLEAGTLHKQAI